MSKVTRYLIAHGRFSVRSGSPDSFFTFVSPIAADFFEGVLVPLSTGRARSTRGGPQISMSFLTPDLRCFIAHLSYNAGASKTR